MRATQKSKNKFPESQKTFVFFNTPNMDFRDGILKSEIQILASETGMLKPDIQMLTSIFERLTPGKPFRANL
jgi:hypothetical protein